MAKENTDDELNLRRKARRRLIGAVALTLAVVVILPMVLDSEPKTGGRDIDLSIPSPDKVGEFVPRVPVSEVAVPLPPASSALETTAPAESDSAGSKQVVTPDATQLKMKMEPTINQPSVPQKSTETTSANKPPSEESYVAQVGAYSNSDTARQELKKLKKWGFRAYTEKAGDKIRVRVGPYQDRDKAEKAGHLLEKHGLHPVIVSSQ